LLTGAVNLSILPLAITMMAGPQIMSAFVFVTAKLPVRVSLAFLVGVAAAVTVGVAVMRGVAALLGSSVSLGDSSDTSSVGTVIQVALVGLLAAMAVKSYLGRETAEPPKWLGTLQEASPRRALEMGLLLILLMPSDIVVMLTVGMNLEHNDSSVAAAIPFIAATVLVAALPLLAFLLFHRRAQSAMPKVRDWMNTHSWLVNIVVCGIFIVLVLGG
jgi:hypothetical protein